MVVLRVRFDDMSVKMMTQASITSESIKQRHREGVVGCGEEVNSLGHWVLDMQGVWSRPCLMYVEAPQIWKKGKEKEPGKLQSQPLVHFTCLASLLWALG